MKNYKTYSLKQLSAFAVVAILVFVLYAKYENEESEQGSWHLETLQVEKMNAISKGDNVTVAVIDLGAPSNVDAASDTNSAKSTDNNLSGDEAVIYNLIHEVAPNVSIITIRVMTDGEQSVSPESIVKALEVCKTQNVDIVNLSLGSIEENEDVSNAIAELDAEGIIVLASAGDYSQPNKLFPASNNQTISVGAYDRNRTEWEKDNAYGANDVLFPGVDITVSDDSGNFSEVSGTSYATALASGYVSLLLSVHPYSTEEIKKLLLEVDNSDYYETLLIESAES